MVAAASTQQQIRRRRGRKKGGSNNDTSTKNTSENKSNSNWKQNEYAKKGSVPTATTLETASVSQEYPLQNHLLIRMNNDENDDANDSNDPRSEHWYAMDSKNSERNATLASCTEAGTEVRLISPSRVAQYRAMADALYRREVQLFHKKVGNQDDDTANLDEKDNRWVESTMKRGTLKDRIAAMSVLLSTDPIHKLYALDGLYQMMGCSLTSSTRPNSNSTSTNDRVAQLAAEAVEDLFINTLLPSNRKLLTLAQRPLHLYEQSNTTQLIDQGGKSNEQNQNKSKKNNKRKHTDSNTKRTLSPKILLLWRFEEMVKEKYEIFIKQYLARIMNENSIAKSVVKTSKNRKKHGSGAAGGGNGGVVIERQKIAAIRTASTLLKSAPELENDLLQLLVNKIGDPTKRIASSASHELRKVLASHPAMTVVVAREVQQLAHRPNLSQKALYNCIAFLNQLKLSSNMFIDHSNTSTTSTTGNKNMKNNITGKQQSEQQDQEQEQKRQTLPASLISTYFRLFEVAVRQATTSDKNKRNKDDKKVVATKSSLSDGMKGRLLSALLTGVNRAHPYLPDSDKDMDEHIDALYRVVHTASPSATTQSLLLLFHLVVGSNYHPAQQQQTKDPSSGVLTKQQSQQDRVAAEVRKDRFYRSLYSTISQHDMITSVGKHSTMYFNLLYKAMRYEKNTSRLVAFGKKLSSYTLHSPSPVIAATLFLLNEIYKYHPVLLSCYDEILFDQYDAKRILDPTKREPRGALVIFDPTGNDEDNNYNDDYTNTDEKKSPSWELSLMKHHFHPSVHLFAKKLGSDDGIDYSGDPLKDFAIGPFLDKFAYRNPKSVEKLAAKYKRGESIAERKIGTDGIIQSHSTTPVNDPEFLSQPSKDYNVQDDFFRKFFQERARRDGTTTKTQGNIKTKKDPTDDKDKKRRRRRNDDDDDSHNDDYYDDTDLDAVYNEEDQQIDIDGNDDPNFDWETDSEEDAFVDTLAQKMFEDASGEYDPADLDDEDPDMDDWDDIGPAGATRKTDIDNVKDNEERAKDAEVPSDDDSGDDEDELDNGATTKFLIRHHNEDESEESDNDGNDSVSTGDASSDHSQSSDDVKNRTQNDDEDAFMEESASDNSDDDDDNLFLDDEMDDDGDDVDDDDDDDDDDESNHDPFLLANEDGDDDSESSLNNKKSIMSKKELFQETFVDADEYSKLINESWNKSKRVKR